MCWYIVPLSLLGGTALTVQIAASLQSVYSSTVAGGSGAQAVPRQQAARDDSRWVVAYVLA